MIYIEQRLESIEKKLDLILDLIGEGTYPMNVTAIASMYGKPRTSMYTAYRYLLPNFGFSSDRRTTVNEWTRKDVIAWNSRPIEERKKEYRNYVVEVK